MKLTIALLVCVSLQYINANEDTLKETITLGLDKIDKEQYAWQTIHSEVLLAIDGAVAQFNKDVDSVVKAIKDPNQLSALESFVVSHKNFIVELKAAINKMVDACTDIVIKSYRPLDFAQSNFQPISKAISDLKDIVSGNECKENSFEKFVNFAVKSVNETITRVLTGITKVQNYRGDINILIEMLPKLIGDTTAALKKCPHEPGTQCFDKMQNDAVEQANYLESDKYTFVRYIEFAAVLEKNSTIPDLQQILTGFHSKEKETIDEIKAC